MLNMEKVKIQLLSGLNVDLSERVHDEYYCEFNERQYYCFSNMINSGQYFPQIMQFINVISCILKRHTTFSDILLCNLIFGAGYTILWHLLKLYKVPGLSFLSCLIGKTIFRLFLHFIIIAVLAFATIGNWKILPYCLIGGFITQIVKSFLCASLGNAKYNDEVAIYASSIK